MIEKRIATYIPTRVQLGGAERIAIVLYRRRGRALAVFFAVIGGVAALTALVPRLYESRMKILVRNDRPDLLVSVASGPANVNATEVTDNSINSEIELMKSNDILGKIVRDCGLD